LKTTSKPFLAFVVQKAGKKLMQTVW